MNLARERAVRSSREQGLPGVEQRGAKSPRGAGGGLAVLAPGAAGWGVQLGGARGNSRVVDVTHLEHLAVGEQPRQRPESWGVHYSGDGKAARVGFVLLADCLRHT